MVRYQSAKQTYVCKADCFLGMTLPLNEVHVRQVFSLPVFILTTTRSLNAGGLVALSRHLAVALALEGGGGVSTYTCVYIYIYMYIYIYV